MSAEETTPAWWRWNDRTIPRLLACWPPRREVGVYLLVMADALTDAEYPNAAQVADLRDTASRLIVAPKFNNAQLRRRVERWLRTAAGLLPT